MERIGYVGLGNMGAALATRLQLSHPLVVYDRSSVALEKMASKGARTASGFSQLAAQCNLIFLCLPTSEDVMDAIFGEGTLASSMKPDTLIIDQTTGDPNVTRLMATRLAERGFHLVDAPVSGGKMGAEAGTIAIMVGGDRRQYDRILPILNAISPNVFYAGSIGNGHVIKLVNNLMSTVQRLLSFEAITLAVKNGMDPAIATDILLASGGRNAYLERMMKTRILKGNLDVGFTLNLAHKDVRLACKLGADSEVPMLFGNMAREIYQTCMNEMGRDSQVDTVGLMYDRFASTAVIPLAHS